MTVTFSTDRKVAAPTTITVTLGTDTDANTADATLTGAGTDVTFGIELVANSGDFVTGTNTFLFNPADVAKRIRFFFVDDNLNEDTEFFTLTVSGGGLTRTTRYGIVDNDPITITLSGGRRVPEENTSPTINWAFSATPSREMSVRFEIYTDNDPETVDATISGGDISTGFDWLPATPPLQARGQIGRPVWIIPAGSTSGQIHLPAFTDDDLNEPDKAFLAVLRENNDNPRDPDQTVGAFGEVTVHGSPQAYTIVDNDPLTARIIAPSPASVNEGQSAVFTVALERRSQGEVTVGYTVTGDADYTDATDGQITFQPALGTRTTRTRNIMAEIELAIPVDSNRDAGSETLTVTLDSISVSRTGGVATVADAPNNSASVTVNYLDPMQTFTLGDPATTTIAEGAAATYTLNRTGPDLATDIVVNWEIVQDDTGNQDSAADFTGATTGSLTFAADDMSQTFQVAVADDDDNELAEMFRLRFGVAAGGAGGVALPAPLEVTIPVDTDDVALITIGRRYNTPAMVGEAASATFIISVVDNEGANGRVPLDTDMVVPFTVSGLDADEFTIIEGDAPGRISADGTGGLATLLSAGQFASATVIVNLVGDSLNEASETLTLTGAPPGPDGLRATPPLGRMAYTDGGDSASVEVTDENPITVSIAAPTPATVNEGATVRFTVTLDVASAGVVTVPYTVSSTAAMPADANNGQITIAAGDTTGGIELAIPDNARLNAGDSETLTVILDQATVAAPGGGTVTSGGSADVTVNYVNTPHVFAVSVDESARSEGDTAVFTVSLTGTTPATPVTVDWEIGGNADASDYVLSGADIIDGSLSFSALESQTITVAIAADGLNESTETVTFTLTDVSPAGPAGILTASATVDIAQSDPLRITMSGGGGEPLNEEDFGTPAMPNTTAVVVRLDFGATLTRTLRVPVIVHAPRDPDTLDSHQSLFGTDDGENFRAQVRASDRYLIAQRGNPLFEFAAGTNSGTIPIPVIDNNRNEPEQAFAVTIGRGASGANLLRDFRPSDDRSYSITGAHGDFTVGVDSQTWTVAASDPLTASIAAQTQTVAEGTTASFRVTLSGAVPTTGTAVIYRIGGSVEAGDDYAGTGTAMVTIPEHLSEVDEYMSEVNTGVIGIAVLSDRRAEGEETMTVTLDSVRSLEGSGYQVGIGTPNTAEVTIPANTAVVHRISVAGPDEVAEGDRPVYTVTLRTSELEPLSSPITVSWGITTDGVSGNLAELSDFSTSGAETVVFRTGAANGSTETIDLGIIVDDTEFERAEEFSVSLSLAVPDPDTELLQSSVDAIITTSDAVQLVAVSAGASLPESRNAPLFGLYAVVNRDQSGLPTEGSFTVTWEVAGSGANPADMDADISGPGTVTAIGDTRTRQETETIMWSSIVATNDFGDRRFVEIASAGTLRFVDDNLNESNEMVTFSIVSVGGLLDAAGEAGAVEIETSQATTIIADNDAITVGIDGPDSVMEGQTARLTVTLPKASVGVVTVPYTVTGGMVTDANNGEITIPAGSTTDEIALMISTDSTLNAGDTATLTVTLGAVTVAAPGRGTVAIIGGSGAASLTVNYVDPTLLAVMAEGVTDVEEGAATTFTVTLTGTALADGTPLTVNWEIGGVNVDARDYALSGADTDGSLSFTAAGSQTVTVAIATDGLNESTETLTFTLTEASPTGLADILTASASVAIAPSDPLRITMSGGETLNEEFLGVEAMAAGVEVIPPMPGTGAGVVQLDFGATLTRELRIPVSIHQDGDLNTFDPVFIGRAFSLGTGWSPALRPAYGRPQVGSTLFNFATGTSAGQIPVPAYNDDPPINEREEAFAMVIDTVTGAHGVPTVVVDSQTWIIEASDPLTAVIAAPTQTALEGEAAEFTVTLAGAAASVDTVLTYTIGGDVVAGDDYTGRSTGTVMFSADTGRANPVRTLAIPVLSDRMQEGEETMTVTLTGVQSPGSEYPISIGTTATATVTIPANSTASRVITAAGPDEVEEGGVSTYTLTLRIPQSESLMTTITVNWSITTDVASANPAELSDFSTSAGTVVFPAGTASGSAETVQSIGLGIVDDEEFERAEEFSVSLILVNPNSATEVMQSMLDTTITGPNDAVQLGVSVISSLLPGVVEGAPQPFRLNAGAYEGGAGLPTEGEFTVTVEVFGSGANPADIRTDITGFGTVVQRGDTEVRRFTDTIAWSTIESVSLSGGVFSSLGPSFQAVIITGVSALTIVDDDVNESTKTMTFRIDSVGGLDTPGEMGAVDIFGSAREVSVAIIDNDAITVGIAPAELSIEEGETAELTVTLDKESQGDVSVSYTVTAGGASAPPYSDVTGGDLTFAAGSTSTVVLITSSQTDDIGAGTGTLTVAFDTVATGPRGGAISSAGMAVITVTFLSFDDRPPMLEGLAWAPGQQTLWLTTNEPFKVLAHPDEPMASSDTASLSGMDVLNVGDFTVLENYVMGMARATTLRVTEVNVMPQNQGLELRLERGLAAAATPLYLRYQHTAGTPAIYDTAFEQGSYDPDMGRNRLASQGPFILRQTGAVGSNGDSDGDGLPDVVEIAIGENPLVAVASTRQPAFSIRSAGTESAPFYIAYSGIRRYGVREHLGVMDTAASVQAYYRSGDFGYSGGVYGCASGAFPANYMAPLSEGGCEPVNWGNIRVGQTYEIAWLARSSDGVWAVNTMTESNLPEQWIQRIPELNMASERVFTTGISVTVLAESDNGRSFSATASTAGVVGITDLSGVGSLSLWSPSTMTLPGSGDDSLGLSTQTTVVLVGSAVPPLLGRAVLRRGSSEVNVLAEGGSYTLSIPVENSADIDGLSAAGSSVSDESGVLSSITGAPAVAGGGYEVMLSVNADVAATTDRAVIRVTIAGVRGGGETVSSYGYPVVRADAPLAAERTDSDGDGIADDYDHYDMVAHLPVTVDEGAGGKSWHHIRPVLSEHDLRLGESTFERLGGLEESSVDEYADYAASRTTGVGSLSAVYDFEISGVAYAGVTEAGGVGGAAGVIIPLPADLHGVGAVTLVKYPSGRLFSTVGENSYGFAPLAEGACPDDTVRAGSPYRVTKSAGDACMVVYIEDGGANDEDGTVNGVIRDPLGIRIGASGGGRRHHGGAFSPAGLAALLLLLAVYSRRRRAA